MKKELSACVIQKLNGYELLRNHLNSRVRKNFVSINVVYEPTLNEKNRLSVFFAPKIYLAFHTNIEKIRDGKKCSVILELDNAITAITILLRAQKRWKNIYLTSLARTDLPSHLIMEK